MIKALNEANSTLATIKLACQIWMCLTVIVIGLGLIYLLAHA
jgi:hypothetical protein